MGNTAVFSGAIAVHLCRVLFLKQNRIDMKTLIKSLILGTTIMLALVLFSSASSFAASGEGVVMEVTGSNTFKLILNDLNGGLTVQIKDQYGYTLHQESINTTTTYGKQFNLSELPNGDYYVELSYDSKFEIYPLSINKGQVEVKTERVKEVFKPVMNLNDNLLSITQLAPRKSTLHVMIYDEDQNLLMNDSMSGEISLGKIYDLSKLEPGQYQVYLASEGRSYQRDLRLQ